MKYSLIALFCCFLMFTACGQKYTNNSDCKSESCIKDSQKHTGKKPVIERRQPTVGDVNLFMLRKTSDEFDNLYYLFLNADSQFEILLYAIIATDKFDIASGYYEIACCLTNCLSYLSIGTHSKEMASHYLRIGSEKDKICAEAYNSLDKRRDYEKMWLPKKNKSPLAELKANSLMGSIRDYNKLKSVLLHEDQYDLLLYYSYIMVERYNYIPAKKDIIDIMEKAYIKYGLGKYGKDADYFCNFFQE